VYEEEVMIVEMLVAWGLIIETSLVAAIMADHNNVKASRILAAVSALICLFISGRLICFIGQVTKAGGTLTNIQAVLLIASITAGTLSLIATLLDDKRRASMVFNLLAAGIGLVSIIFLAVFS